MVGSIWIFGSTSGGLFGGTICVSANFGGVPFVTGVGPRCPPPPPILSAFGGACGGLLKSQPTNLFPHETKSTILTSTRATSQTYRATYANAEPPAFPVSLVVAHTPNS